MSHVYGIIILLAVVAFFLSMMLTGRKLKEYAVYGVDGDILHLWRRQQNWWFDWGGQMVFYERDGESKIFIQQHWVKRYKELKKGDWEKIADSMLKDK